MSYFNKRHPWSWFWRKRRRWYFDTIGVAISNKGLMMKNLNSWFIPIKGVVCSTNYNSADWEDGLVFAKCDSVVLGNG